MPKSTPLKWHGGKSYLADWIVGYFPDHVHYCEPYFGGGQVLFAKPQNLVENHSECVNDLDDRLMNFWRVMKDFMLFSQFRIQAELTPLSETEFHESKASLEAGKGDLIQQAMNFFIQYRQSRQGLGKCFATLSKSRTRQGMNEQVAAWLSAVEGLPDFHARLKRVAILNRSALRVIQSEDSPTTLFYLDPPYLPQTRSKSAKSAYGQFEMDYGDHAELLQQLSKIQGKFILSGYPSVLYDEFSEANNWRMVSQQIDNKASSKKNKKLDPKTECLWMNF